MCPVASNRRQEKHQLHFERLETRTLLTSVTGINCDQVSFGEADDFATNDSHIAEVASFGRSSNIRQVTNFVGTYSLSNPSISDGKIAYQADPPGADVLNVYVYDIQTGVTTNITGFTTNTPTVIVRDPSISDGIVAYTIDPPGATPFNLFAHNLQTGQTTQVTNFVGNYSLSFPSVSNGKIVYQADPPGPEVLNVFAYDLQSGVTTNVTGFTTNPPSTIIREASISDGIVAYTIDPPGVTPFNLFAHNLQTGQTTQLTNFTGNYSISFPSVSNGKIVYQADPPGPEVLNVFTYDLQTGDLTNVTGFTTNSPTVFFRNPDISNANVTYSINPPGGTSQSELFVHNLQTDDTTQLVDFTVSDPSISGRTVTYRADPPGSTSLNIFAATFNHAPMIISPSSIDIPENQTPVIDVQSSDPDSETEGDGLSYAVTGGADQALFSIVADTGELTFISPPDFEIPGDADNNNIYDVQVIVTDSGGLTDVQNLQVTVTDVRDPLRFDFGPGSSPVAAGYIGVGADTYDPSVGYGWIGKRGLSAQVNSRGNDLTGDRIQMASSTFTVDLPDDTYDLDIEFGFVLHLDSVLIDVEGSGGDVFTPVASMVRNYTVTVTDGQLNVRFNGNFGVDSLVRFSGMTISPSASGGFREASPNLPPGSDPDRDALLASQRHHPARVTSWNDPLVVVVIPATNELRDIATQGLVPKEEPMKKKNAWSRPTVIKSKQTIMEAKQVDDVFANMFEFQITSGEAGAM